MVNNILSPFQLLELNVISGQDLAVVSRKMRTYAIAWVHPERKLSTRVDIEGHNNPTWNDKFVFRVDNDFLRGETSAVMIEIYAYHWFRDIHVGTVRILVGNVVQPETQPINKHAAKAGTKFVALQVRRASGRPQGILNIGVAVLNSSMRSMPLYTQLSTSAVGFRDLVGKNSSTKTDESSNDQFLLPWYPKPELRRVKSDSSSLIRPIRVKATKSKASSMINGSEILNTKRSKKKLNSKVNGSNISVNKNSNSATTDSTFSYGRRGTLTLEKNKMRRKTKSESGPSVSEVAANDKTNKKNTKNAMGEGLTEEWRFEEDSTECLRSKLERWRTEIPPAFDVDAPSSSIVNTGKKDYEGGRDDGRACTCYGKICGLEISIICGGKDFRRKRKMKRREKMDYWSIV